MRWAGDGSLSNLLVELSPVGGKTPPTRLSSLIVFPRIGWLVCACQPADAQLLVKGPLQAALRMESLGLDSPILEAVRALGIAEFTEPQVRAIPRILAGA